MTVSRKGIQIRNGKHPSHISGKKQHRFAQKLQTNFDAQVKRLEQELCKKGK